jgi:hypothetical protein
VKRTSSTSAVVVLCSLLALVALAALLYKRAEMTKAPEVVEAPPLPAPPSLQPIVDAPEPEVQKRIARPRDRVTVLHLKSGEHLCGLVKQTEEGYRIDIDGLLRDVRREDVDSWYRNSGEMGYHGTSALAFAKDLYQKGLNNQSPVLAEGQFLEARAQAQKALTNLTLTQTYFVGQDAEWVVARLIEVQSLLALIRGALKGSGEAVPRAPRAPEVYKPAKVSTAISAGVRDVLRDPDKRSVAEGRREARNLFLQESAGWPSTALREAIHVFLSRDDFSWGLRVDRLTLTGAAIEYEAMPGRILRKSALAVEFELAQGGVVQIQPGGDRAQFTPPGGEPLQAARYLLQEGVRTRQADAMGRYLKEGLEAQPAAQTRESHLRALKLLTAEVAQARKDDPSTSPEALQLFAVAHLSELATPTAAERAAVEEAIKTLRLVKHPQQQLWGAPVALGRAMLDKADLPERPGIIVQIGKLAALGEPSAAFIHAHLLLKDVGSEVLPAQAALDRAAGLQPSGQVRVYLRHLADTLRALTPCKVCGGKHTAVNSCGDCRGKGRRDLRCGNCSGHGYRMVLSTAGLVRQDCRPCDASGWFRNVLCKSCNGSGELNCRSCKGPASAPALGDLVALKGCPTCGGDGLLFTNAVVLCPDCMGVGQCATPQLDESKAFARPVRENDWRSLVGD